MLGWSIRGRSAELIPSMSDVKRDKEYMAAIKLEVAVTYN